MTNEQFRSISLSFCDAEENPHFDRVAFKVRGRRIFATLHEPSHTANLKLTPVDQSVFCNFGRNGVYAVPNKWGAQGWTTFELKKLPEKMIIDALETAYRQALERRRR